MAKKTAKKAVKKIAQTIAKRFTKITKKITPKSITKPAAAKRAPAKAAAKKAPAATASLRSIAPGFTVNDIQKSIDWYDDMLGFVVKERWEDKGKLLGAEMSSGDVSIYLSQDDWKQGRDRAKGQGTRMYVTTGEAVDGLADRIKGQGGTLDQEPKDDWGMRTFAVSDPDGYKLTFMFTPKKK